MEPSPTDPIPTDPIPSYPKVSKLCLNMIVKNESKIILRILSSVSDMIDGYCICDTGSTDNTKELITEFFQEKGIPGKIIDEPFRDFGYNRSVALKACESMPEMDYILLLDADMVLEGNALKFSKEFKMSLTLDYYHIFQGNPTYYYKNVRIVKNCAGFSYWGVTHEYVNAPQNSVVGNIDRTILFISDIGDGGAKSDKIDRDIRLLEQGLRDLPKNDRYTYYLANSYRDGRRYEDAIRMYKERIQIGGWIEEIWQSYYCIGKCYMEMSKLHEFTQSNDSTKKEYEQRAIFAWLEGYNAHPCRIENLYKIIEHYRITGKNQLAYQFYKIADQSRKRWTNWSEYLFLERDVYDYKIDYEFSIVFYYVKELAMSEGFCPKKISMYVLNDPHAHGVYNNVMSNYKFYTDALTLQNEPNLLTIQQQKVLDSIGIHLNIPTDNGEFVRSTPTVCKRENQLLVNVRYVNYRIDSQGNYINKEHITTMNAFGVIDISKDFWKLTDEFLLDYDTEEDGRYVGQEDLRLFVTEDNSVYYHANRGLKSGNMCVEQGELDLAYQSCKDILYLKRNGSTLEKNWALCPSPVDSYSDKVPLIIYGWSPLLIGKADESGEFQEMTREETPACFRNLRGSTNGIVVGDEIWFICHTVSYEDRRYYYHHLVALNAKTLKLSRYSNLFTFEKEKVEYTLGITKIDETILVGYSVYDSSCKFVQYPVSFFDAMLQRI